MLCVSSPALAVPDLASRRTVDSLTVYADDRRPDLYYYVPPGPRLSTDPDGRPDVSLALMRYSGTARSGDRGLVLHRSVLTLRVELPEPPRDALARCARTLGGAELRPLPIRRLEAALVYVPIGASGDSAREVPGGSLQAGGMSSAAATDTYWHERVFTVALDSLTAQVMEEALRRRALALSLGYALVTDARAVGSPRWEGLARSRVLSGALMRRLVAPGTPGTAAPGAAPSDSILRLVADAGAIPIHVDTGRWPDLIRQVDVDAGSREGFVSLEAYCYDFHDGRRPDLYEKQVEIEAEGVGGQAVRLLASFARNHPDVYSARLTFPVAVRLDRNYRYRTTELRPDGSSSQSGWHTGRDWISLLDLTTPAPRSGAGVRPIR